MKGVESLPSQLCVICSYGLLDEPQASPVRSVVRSDGDLDASTSSRSMRPSCCLPHSYNFAIGMSRFKSYRPACRGNCTTRHLSAPHDYISSSGLELLGMYKDRRP